MYSIILAATLIIKLIDLTLQGLLVNLKPFFCQIKQ